MRTQEPTAGEWVKKKKMKKNEEASGCGRMDLWDIKRSLSYEHDTKKK